MMNQIGQWTKSNQALAIVVVVVVGDGERWRGVCFAGKERDAGSGVAGASSKVGSKQEGGHGMKALFSFMLTCVEWAAYFRPC